MGCRTIIGLLLLVQGVYQFGVVVVVLTFGGWQAVGDRGLHGAMRFWIGVCSLVLAAVVIPWWRWVRRS